MKTIIELARKAGLLDGTLPVPQTVERFATLHRAEIIAELTAGVEMPEPRVLASPLVPNLGSLFTEAQMRETVAAAVAKKDAEISAIRAAHKRYEADTMTIAQTDDEVRASLTSQRDTLKAENERLRADAATAVAIERAAKELPEFYNITIKLERGYGGVRLSDPNNEVTAFEFDEGDAGLSDCINEAIDAALKGQP